MDLANSEIEKKKAFIVEQNFIHLPVSLFSAYCKLSVELHCRSAI